MRKNSMRKNRLYAKRIVAAVLSLSMAASQASVTGLGMTAYAAEAESGVSFEHTEAAGSEERPETETDTKIGGVTENEAGTETEGEAGTETGTETEGEAGEETEGGAGAETGAETEGEAGAENGGETEGEAGTENGGESEDKAGTESEKKTEEESEGKSESEIESKTEEGFDEKPDADSDSEEKPEVDSEGAARTDLDDKADTKTDVETVSKDNAAFKDESGTKKEYNNPFGLADEDLPLDLSEEFLDLLSDIDEIELRSDDALDEEEEDEENTDPDTESITETKRKATIQNFKTHYSGNSFTFFYTSVAHKQKKFTVSKDYSSIVEVLAESYQCERNGEIYYGAKILSVLVTVIDGEDKLKFYADGFANDDFYISADLVFGTGDRFTEPVYYIEDPEQEDSEWVRFTDVSLHGGMLKLKLKLRKTCGAYVAPIEATSKTGKKAKALILAVDGDSSLGSVPVHDAEALQLALLRTNQFQEEDVVIFPISAAEADSEASKSTIKQQIWECIDEYAADEENELTLIAYSGHGNYTLDGTSELSLGGDNSITAQELKNHVSKLHGKVVLLFDSCFSGGMIMPTTLDEMEAETGDTDETDYDQKVMAQTQKEADQAMQSFVQDFKSAKAKTAEAADSKTAAVRIATASQADKTSNQKTEYYIYAAASPYETSLQTDSGQLIEAFGCALGYYRKNAEYDVFSADKNQDYEVSAKELADYIKTSCTYANPSVYYPSGHASDTLFSYDEEAGRPAVFSLETLDDHNIIMEADGSVTVKVRVTNHSLEPAEFDAAALNLEDMSAPKPGEVDLNSYAEENKHFVYYNEGNHHAVDGGESEIFELTFTDESKTDFAKGGRFFIKIWGTGDTDSVFYDVADFYINRTKSAAAADKDALVIRKPAQVNKAGLAVEAASYLPINVTFDGETVQKTGYAALTLTAKAYDLGTDAKDDRLSEDDRILAADGTVVSTEDELQWITLYENVRPTYQRDSQYAGEDKSGSYYAYTWDVSELPRDHYYALKVSAQHDDGEIRTKTTFVKIVDQEEAKKATNVIGEQYVDMSYFAKYRYGILLPCYNADGTETTYTATRAANQLRTYLNLFGEKYDVGTPVGVKAGIRTTKRTGWYTVEDGTLTDMQAEDTFEPGKDYVSRIIMTIDKDYDARFTEDTLFRFGGHSLYTGDPAHPSGIEIKEDGKKAYIYVLHKNMGLDPSKVKVCRAGTTQELTSDSELQVGDQIDIYTGGYQVGTNKYSSLKDDPEKGDGYLRYTVTNSSKDEVYFWIYDHKSGTEDEDCGCAAIGYKYQLADSENEDAIESIEAPKNTFYALGKDNHLDVSDSEVTFYQADSEQLSDLLADGAALYTKDEETEEYEAWTDDKLKEPGMQKLYLFYEGKYYEAFDILAGYEQGANFEISGAFTFNEGSTPFYLKDEERKDTVLLFGADTEADGEGGLIHVEHSVLAKDENTNASEYSDLYFTNEACVRYLLPYPEELDQAGYEYEVVDAEKNVPVSFELREAGFWITAKRSGTFDISYRKRTTPESEPTTKPEPNSTPDSKPSGGDDRDAENSILATGNWQPETVRLATAETPGAIRVNGYWILPSVSPVILSGQAAGNAASGSMSGTVNLYRFRLTNGEYATGWKLIHDNGGNRWFYFAADGYMRTGWIFYNSSWYYLGTDGAMMTGWIQEGEKQYFLLEDGRMADPK